MTGEMNLPDGVSGGTENYGFAVAWVTWDTVSRGPRPEPAGASLP